MNPTKCPSACFHFPGKTGLQTPHSTWQPWLVTESCFCLSQKAWCMVRASTGSQLWKPLTQKAHCTRPHISPSLPSPGVGVRAGRCLPGPVWAALDQHCAPELAACLDALLKVPPTLKEADSPGLCCASGDAGCTLNPTDHPSHTLCSVPTAT